jgi:peptidyl-prolyl cis-trans isomerase B (cyclophilin B)
MWRLPVTTLCALALLAAGCGDDSKDTSEPATSSATSETAPTQTETATAGGCEPAEAPPAREDGGERKPKGKLNPDKTYTVTVKTNCGSFSWDLDLEAAPKTSASIVALAKKGFYDGTVFHRIVPGFVIQGGDPTGSGGGGPGYKTRDIPPADTIYGKGTVAMAKAGDEPAGTAGSQFFVVTADAGGAQLTPDYAVIGRVSKGIDTVDTIGRLGDANQQPTQVVVIEKMSVRVK